MEKNIQESSIAHDMVGSEPGMCWLNASYAINKQRYPGAKYVEGVVVTEVGSLIHEHAWIIFEGEIIDPTLPELALQYLPWREWSHAEFEADRNRRSDLPFFRQIHFLTNGVQEGMDEVRAKAKSLVEQRGNNGGKVHP